MKKITVIWKIPVVCKAVSVMLAIAFVVISIIDYMNYNPICTSAPYYVHLLVNALFLLTPAIIVFIIGVFVKKKQ